MKRKSAYNCYIDHEVHMFLANECFRKGATIVENLSRKFMEEFKKNPAILTSVLMNRFSITIESDGNKDW